MKIPNHERQSNLSVNTFETDYIPLPTTTHHRLVETGDCGDCGVWKLRGYKGVWRVWILTTTHHPAPPITIHYLTSTTTQYHLLPRTTYQPLPPTTHHHLEYVEMWKLVILGRVPQKTLCKNDTKTVIHLWITKVLL